MAFLNDPPDPGANPVFANERITPEDAERLAAMFRPSWEIDEASFPGAGTLAEADLRAPKGAGTAADVRGAVQALNGTHAPAPATVLMHEEPSSSVIVDGAIAPEMARVAPSFADAQTGYDRRTHAGSAAKAAMLPPAARVALPQQRTLVMTNSPVPAAIAAERRRARTLGLSKVDFRPSRTGFWIALGSIAGVLLGIVIWLASGSGDKPAAPVPAAEATQAAARNPVPPPPPPVETAVAQPTAAPTPPPIAPPPAPPPPAPVAAVAPERPVAAPAPPPAPPPSPARLVVAAPPPPRPAWTPSVAPPPPRPAVPKPKTGQTIVRDVPF